MDTKEDWKDIPTWEGLYQASALGRVRSLDRIVVRPPMRGHGKTPFKLKGRVLAGGHNRFTGYTTVMLTDMERRECRAIHRLVCRAFHGEPPTKRHQAAHIDGNKSDNRPENLVWATPKENSAHRYAHGTVPMGERHVRARLTTEQVIAARRRHASGETIVSIASDMGVKRCVIGPVVRRKTWKHI